jgi:hypothetical protein
MDSLLKGLRGPTLEKAPDATMMPTMAPRKVPPTKRPSLPWLVAAKRRRGRQPVSQDPAQQDRHRECAGLMLLTDWPVRRIAASFGISRETAYQWYRLALSYPGAKSEALRKLAAKRPRSRR